jgi:Rieske 2Fe-2S family protein
MKPLSQPDLAALVARRAPGHPREAPFYTSAEVLDLDLEVIFGCHWIFVAVEPEVPEPGDYVTVDIGVSSIIILRNDNGEVRAFHADSGRCGRPTTAAPSRVEPQ